MMQLPNHAALFGDVDRPLVGDGCRLRNEHDHHPHAMVQVIRTPNGLSPSWSALFRLQ
jgi:hypothetical protein